MLIPTVIEKSYDGERAYDLYSRLLKDRIVFLNGEINDESSNLIVAQLLHLDAQEKEKKKDIRLYINSPGGTVTGTLAIYDTIQHIDSKISTICVGMAASGAAIILSAGEPGKRFSLPHSKIMVHQPIGGAEGQATDIEINAREILKTKKTLNEILAKHTRQPFRKVEKDTDRDFYMDAKEAKSYGIVDKVVK